MAITLPRPTATRAVTAEPAVTAEKVRGIALSATRIIVSFLFACHGADTLFGVFGGTHTAAFGSWPGWWAAAIELVGGILVLFGVFTRGAATLCSGAMAYAYFTVHQATGLLPIQNHGEPAALYAWIFLLIAILGPGSLTLGALFRRRA